MALRFMLLITPVLIIAKIEVNVTGKFSEDEWDLAAPFAGVVVNNITDTERTTFNVSDDVLKNGIKSFSGERPTDTFLRSPTPWGDPYQSKGWRQVVRTLSIERGKFLNVSSRAAVIVQQVFENNGSKPRTININLCKEVQNTVSSSWYTNGEFSVGEKIIHNIKLALEEVGGEFSFFYTSSWGKNTTELQTVTLRSSTTTNLVLEPGQNVVAQLRATKGSIRLEMEYEAYLSGHVFVHYSARQESKKFWMYDIEKCMNNSNQVISREVIDIEFYVDSKIVVLEKI